MPLASLTIATRSLTASADISTLLVVSIRLNCSKRSVVTYLTPLAWSMVYVDVIEPVFLAKVYFLNLADAAIMILDIFPASALTDSTSSLFARSTSTIPPIDGEQSLTSPDKV